MREPDGTREELIAELERLRLRIAELEGADTNRRHTTEALQESEERFRILGEMMHEGFVVVDYEGRMTYVNDRFCEMTEYSPEEVVGRFPTEFVEEPDIAVLKQQFTAAKKGDPNVCETAYMCKGGRRIPLLSSGNPDFVSDVLYVGVRMILTDISERI